MRSLRWWWLLVVTFAFEAAEPPPPSRDLGRHFRWSWRAPGARWNGAQQRWEAPGAALQVQDRRRGFHWELHAEAGAATPLQFRVEGARAGFVRGDGTLVVEGRGERLTETAVVAWQPRPDGTRRFLRTRYEGVQQSQGGVDYALALEDVDAALPVVVDPEVSLYEVGGPGDDAVIATRTLGTSTLVATNTNGLYELKLFDRATLQQTWRPPAGLAIVDVQVLDTAVLVLLRTNVRLLNEVVLGGGGWDGAIVLLDSTLSQREVARFGTSADDSFVALAVADSDLRGPGPTVVAAVGSTAGDDVFPVVGPVVPGNQRGIAVILPIPLADTPRSGAGVLLAAGGPVELGTAVWTKLGLWVGGDARASDLLVTREAVQAAPMTSSGDSFLAALDVNGHPLVMSYFGSGTGTITGLLRDKRSNLIVLGSGAAPHPFYRQVIADRHAAGYLSVLDVTGANVLSSSPLAVDGRPVGGFIGGDVVGVVGTSTLDFEALGGPQLASNGDEDAALSLWSTTTGRPLWGSWFGGAQRESRPSIGVEMDRGRLVLGVATDSDEFQPTSAPLNPAVSRDVRLVELKDLPNGVVASLGVFEGTEGQCSPPISVKFPMGTRLGGAVRVSVNGRADVYADPDCRRPISALAMDDAEPFAAFFVRADPSAGPVNVDVSVSSSFGNLLGSIPQPLAVPELRSAPGFPVLVEAGIGSCVPLGPDRVGIFTAFTERMRPAGPVFGDLQCSRPTAGPDEFASFLPPQPGVYYLQSAGSGYRTQTAIVVASRDVTPDTLTLVSSTNRLEAGKCSGPHVLVQRAAGEPASRGGPLDITLNSADVDFFSDPDCQASLKQVFIASGSSATREFYVRASRTGVGQAVFASALPALTARWEVLPGAVKLLAIEGPRSLASGECAQLRLESYDASKNVSAEQRAGGLISLDQTGTGVVAFFLDRECRSQITERSWPWGMWWVPFWVQGQRAGDVRVTTRFDGMEATTDLTLSGVGPVGGGGGSGGGTGGGGGTGATPQSLVVTGPTAGVRGGCSGAFSVLPLDGSGQPIQLNANLALASDDPSMTFYSDAACGTAITGLASPIPTSGRSFYVRTTRVGVATIAASGAGLTGTSSVTNGFAPPASIAVTPSPASVQRDGCASLSVSLLDANGLPSTGTVAVTSAGASALTFGASACTGAAGLSLSFINEAPLPLFVSGAEIGSGVVNLALGGSLVATVPVSITAPPVERWRFKSLPDGGSAAFSVVAGACTPVSFEALDARGRTTPGSAPPLSPVTVTFHDVADCDGGLVSAGPAFVPELGATVFVRATQVQSTTLVVGDGGQADQAPFTVSPAAPARVTAPPALAFEGRTCASLGPITVQDAFGNDVASWAEGLQVSALGSATVSPAGNCAGAQPTLGLSSFPATLTVTATTQGTTSVVFASADGGAAVVGASTQLVVGWPRAVGLSLRDAGTLLVAGECGGALLFALDDGGVPTRLASATPLQSDSATGAVFSNGTCADGGAASLERIEEGGAAVSFRETRAGATTFTFGSIPWPVVVQPAAPARFALPAFALTEKDCAPVQLSVVDTFGNLSPTSGLVTLQATGALDLSVAAGSACALTSSAQLVLNAQARRDLAVTALRSGQATLEVSGLGLPTLPVAVVVNAGNNWAPTLAIDPAVLVVDEGDAGRFDVTARDIEYDPLSWTVAQVSGPTRALALLGPAQTLGTFTGSAVLVVPADGSVTRTEQLEYAVFVDDGFGHVVDGSVRVVVRDTVNELPVAVADFVGGDGGRPRVPSTAVFRVSGARSSDPNPEALTFSWAVDGGLALATPTASELTLVAPAVGPSGGTLAFELTVSDPRGGTARAQLDVDVFATDTPVITSTPRTLARAGTAWLYDDDGAATAAAQNVVRWSLQGPSGATVDPATGFVSWTPATGGTYGFTLRAGNAFGWVEQRFEVRVLEPPVITSQPANTAALLLPWRYDLDGRAEGRNITWWRLGAHPTGMVIEGSTGAITWTPLVQGLVRVELIGVNAVGEAMQAFDVAVGDGSMVQIADTANRQAQRGVGYVFDADRTLDVTPAGTAVRLVSGPERFFVSPRGEVSWIPTETGDFEVEVAAGAPVAAVYRFTIRVGEPSSEAPLAVATATPPSAANAPLATRLDGSASRPAPGRALVLWAWEAGDGTPPVYAQQLDVTYTRPGGYLPRLEVADDLGNRASTTVNVGVGIDGVLPPVGEIRVVSTELLGPTSTRVTFACDCSDPAGLPLTLSWRFGDGQTFDGAAPEHVYASFSHFRVRLDVSNGRVVTRLVKELELRDGDKRPPLVRAWAQPVQGRAPLSVRFTSAAADFDGLIASRQWDFGGGVTAMADETTHRFDEPGRYTVVFRGTDDDGLHSEDSVEIVVTGEGGLEPPEFTSRPATLTAKVGEAWRYDEDGRLAARGATRYGVGRERNGTVQGAPEGLTVDPQTGLVTWTPQAPGAWPVIFWAENAAGRTWQGAVVVDVLRPPSGCGCGSVDVSLGLGAVALLLFRRRR